jgi:hypothetical protein
MADQELGSAAINFTEEELPRGSGFPALHSAASIKICCPAILIGRLNAVWSRLFMCLSLSEFCVRISQNSSPTPTPSQIGKGVLHPVLLLGRQ